MRVLIVLVTGAVLGVVVYAILAFHGSSSVSLAGEAYAQEPATFSPVSALSNRDVYYPGTEDLAPDEMRVTACGTGMPNARPKQAAAC